MKKRYMAVFAVLCFVAILAAGCGSNKKGTGDDLTQEDYVPVEVSQVKKESISNMSTLSGKVLPDKDVMVLPKIPGKVTSIKVGVGDTVKSGQLLFSLDREDIEKQVAQAKSSLNLSKANYDMNEEKMESAALNLERTQALYEHGAVSRVQYEQAVMAASDKVLDVAKAQLNQAQLAYNQASQSLQNTYVKSPISGIVSAVNIEVGEMASNAQPSMSIVDMDTVYVEISVTENLINLLQEGQEVRVAIESASSDLFTGKIHTISPVSDARTQLYPVKISVDNKEHIIKPGMFAKVELDTDVREDAIIIDSAAVVEKGGKTLVYVVEGDKAIEKEIVLGLDDGTRTEIISGISESDSIIVKGQEYVENGTKVKIVRGEN